MFDITSTDGVSSAFNGNLKVESPEGKMFKRKAIKWTPKGQTSMEWLVVELDGVKVYFMDSKVIVTKAHLRP